MHVMIMNNVFKTKLSIDERYDLKGSWIDRSVKGHSENPSSLLGKDTDLKRNLNLTLKDQECILTQIEADTKVFFFSLDIFQKTNKKEIVFIFVWNYGL